MTLRRTKINKQQQQLSLSTQAYKLFSKGKPPLEVAVTLNLRVKGNYIIQRISEAQTITQSEYGL